MLIQCPQCQTVFRAMPSQLRAAAGRVRCGQCDTVFDALANSEEDLEAAQGHTRTDLDLESAGELEPDPLDDTAEHELLEVEIESTPSIEITMEGERINIDGEDLPLSLRDADDDGEEAWEEPVDRPGLAETAVELERFIPPDASPHEEREFFLPSGARVAFAEAHQEAAEMSLPPALEPRPQRRAGWLWGAGSALLTLAVLTQVVHFNRDALARTATLGGAIIRIYEQMGISLSPGWDLDAYELRQWGATADPEAGGALRVRVSLFNRADVAQPYPLLRLTLQDRFGGQIGARDLTPEEYMKKPVEQLLAAGQRVDAQIVVVDPGKEAVGFEIDVCLQQRGIGVVCANDRK